MPKSRFWLLLVPTIALAACADDSNRADYVPPYPRQLYDRDPTATIGTYVSAEDPVIEQYQDEQYFHQRAEMLHQNK